MSNLLPAQRQADVWRMYRARFLIATSLVLFAVAALSACALLPSYLALSVAGTKASQQHKTDTTAAQDRDAIARAQSLSSVLAPLLSATTSSALIKDAIEQRPASVRLTHITASAGHPGSLIIAGVAGNTQAISQYQSALRADANFTSVSVPVNDLVGVGNSGQFTVTLSGNF